MVLGILSDSHGRVEPTREAVSALQNAGATMLIHLGDVGSEEVLDELLTLPAMVVFGNCDDEHALGRHAERIGVKNCHPVGRLEVSGKRIVFSHGHLEQAIQSALRDGVEYFLHGHTHEVRDERVGVMRVINPGALHRAARYTAALLDPALDQLNVLEVSRPNRLFR